ncbi:MAG: radical SAM protein [Endomicrobiales bacterium]|nr:radical SAM protein [Endomicrobiales bacterium]
MKIALVICPFWDYRYPPLSIALLSAVLKKHGHEVKKYDLNKRYYDDIDQKYRCMWKIDNPLVDENVLNRLFPENGSLMDKYAREIVDSGARVAGFSVYSSSRVFSIELARRVKRVDPGVKTVFGGPEMLFWAGQLSHNDDIDHVVVGEGETALRKLVEYIGNGRAVTGKKIYGSGTSGEGDFVLGCGCGEDLNGLPVPDFEGMAEKYEFKKRRILPIQGSRGCINRCAFCNDVLYSPKFRQKNAKKIYAEIMDGYERYGANQFIFHDSLINADIKVLDELCDVMIERSIDNIVKGRRSGSGKEDRSIIWSAQAVIRPEMTYELLKKMKMAGCFMLEYGIESGSQRVLKAMNKKYSLDDAEKVLSDTKKAGIKCWINIMPGLPTETREDFGKTLDFLKKNRRSIYRVSVSQSFCSIADNTALKNFPERYGVKKDPHYLYWVSNNGENDYEERMRRYRELSKVLRQYGIIESESDGWMNDKMMILLSRYYQYKNDSSKMNEALKRFANDNNPIRSVLNLLSCSAQDLLGRKQ